MRVAFLFAAVSLAAFPAFAKPVDGLALETSAWQAFREKDAARFGALMAPDFVGVYADGVHDRAKDMALLKVTTLRTFRLSDFKSRMIDADDLLVTYSAEVTSAKSPAPRRIWNASLWHLEHGRGVTVYHTEIVAK